MSKKFETKAIRDQLERQYLEHSSPLFPPQVSFLRTMRICALLLLKKRIVSTVGLQPNTSEFISKVCAMEGAAGVAYATGCGAALAPLLLKSGDHRFCTFRFWLHSLFTKFLP